MKTARNVTFSNVRFAARASLSLPRFFGNCFGFACSASTSWRSVGENRGLLKPYLRFVYRRRGGTLRATAFGRPARLYRISFASSIASRSVFASTKSEAGAFARRSMSATLTRIVAGSKSSLTLHSSTVAIFCKTAIVTFPSPDSTFEIVWRAILALDASSLWESPRWALLKTTLRRKSSIADESERTRPPATEEVPLADLWYQGCVELSIIIGNSRHYAASRGGCR